ncbi:MAG: ATP-binding protein [Pseudomonadota bacterium]
MVAIPTQKLQQSYYAIARSAILTLFGLLVVLILAFTWLALQNLQQATYQRTVVAGDRIQSLYAVAAAPTDPLFQKRVEDYYFSLIADATRASIVITDTNGDRVLALPDEQTYGDALTESNGVSLQNALGQTQGRATVRLTPTRSYRQLILAATAALMLSALVLWVALRRLAKHDHNMETGRDEILDAFDRFEQADFRDDASLHGPLELLQLQSATNHLARALAGYRDSLAHQVEEASQEVAQTLEEMEIKNVELDLARRRAVDANHAKSSFLANISHEIRTPMNGIIGHLQLLDRSTLNEQQSRYVNRTLQAANALLDIIDDTLNLSRIEANKLDLQSRPFDLVEEVNRCLVMQAPGAIAKDLDLYFFCDQSFPKTLIGDSLRVRQVVTNLVSNAIKYTHSGSVRVSLESASRLGNKHDVVLRVRDTGLGMDSAQIDSLFEAFSQAGRSPESGTGLGLLITRSLTEAMGGSLDLVSDIDQGSTFTITLPMQQHGQESTRATLSIDGVGGVLCDDDEAQRYYSRLLAANGVTPTDDGARTIDLMVLNCAQLSAPTSDTDLVNRCAAHETPHIVLLSSSNLALMGRLNALSHCEALPLHSPAPAVVDALARLMSTDSDTTQSDATPAMIAGDGAKLADVRILLADDDNFGRAYMQDLLNSHGAKVTPVVNGAEAATAASQQDYDLIVLDIRMPICDGIEATRRIRAAGRTHVPIIGMTASVVPEQHRQCMQAGMTDYWVKPLKIAQLVGGLEHWLGKSPDRVDQESPEKVSIDASLAALDDEMRDMLVTELGLYHARLKDVSGPDVDFASTHELAHKLSGTASICRLHTLRDAALQLQTTASNRDLAHLPTALDDVTQALDAVRDRMAEATSGEPSHFA